MDVTTKETGRARAWVAGAAFVGLAFANMFFAVASLTTPYGVLPVATGMAHLAVAAGAVFAGVVGFRTTVGGAVASRAVGVGIAMLTIPYVPAVLRWYARSEHGLLERIVSRDLHGFDVQLATLLLTVLALAVLGRRGLDDPDFAPNRYRGALLTAAIGLGAYTLLGVVRSLELLFLSGKLTLYANGWQLGPLAIGLVTLVLSVGILRLRVWAVLGGFLVAVFLPATAAIGGAPASFLVPAVLLALSMVPLTVAVIRAAWRWLDETPV